jgi:hypothetical protein
MDKSVVKTSKIIKDATSSVRAHFDVFDRARDIYLGQIKRAEIEYNDRLKRALIILTGEEEAVGTPPPAHQEATN